MDIESQKWSRRRLWRWALLALVVLPFLPEAIILMTAAATWIGGCTTGNACALGPLAAETVRLATEVGVSIGAVFGVGPVLIWLLACYVAITRGWDGLPGRLWLAFAVTLVLGSLPYIAPDMALGPFKSEKCIPTAGGMGGCEIYGQKVGVVVHEADGLVSLMFAAAPLTLAAFALYVIVAIVLRVRSRKRAAPAKTA